MNKEIRVLQLIDSLDVGGAEMLAVNIFNLLSKRDHVRSFLCVTRAEGKLKTQIKEEESYLFLNKKNKIDFSAIVKLVRFIKKNKIEVIHAHSSSFFMAFCVKLCKPSLKLVWHDHYGKSDFLEERKFGVLQYFSFSFSYIISVNSNLEKWAKKSLYCNNVTFLNNFPFFNDLHKTTNLKGVDGKRIVQVAAFRPQKDHLNLLKSFLRIQEKYPEWTLHLIGGGINQSYETEIVDFIQNHGLKMKVFMYGVCTDIEHILSQASIGVLSSKSEGLPISLLEYGLAKLPVVVTKVGECDKVVLHDRSGLVVPKEDSEAFSKSMTILMNNDKKRNHFGEELYIEIKKKYAKEHYINKLINIYTRIYC